MYFGGVSKKVTLYHYTFIPQKKSIILKAETISANKKVRWQN